MPVISVTISTYNVGAFIAETISSVLAQSFQDWELILVDDASTDDTVAQIIVFAQRDTRIRFFQNAENHGTGYTLNRCMQEATGMYIARLDADDTARNQWLEHGVAFMRTHPDHVLVSFPRMLINTNGHLLGRSHESSFASILGWELIFGNPIPHSGTIYPIDIIREIGGYDVKLRTGQDWDLWTRLMASGTMTIKEPPMIHYRVREQSLSSYYKNDREYKEPIVRPVMERMAKQVAGMQLPDDLIWLLYRNRPIVQVDRQTCMRAIQCVFDIADAYRAQHGITDVAPLLGSSVLDKIAHISLSANWSPATAHRVIISVVRRFGLRSLTSRVGCLALVKLLFPWYQRIVTGRAPSISA